jgi:hypothetical protein
LEALRRAGDEPKGAKGREIFHFFRECDASPLAHRLAKLAHASPAHFNLC